ncbi:MAG: hypothetical protein HQK76_01630 [Desulfobacterales bacterium]|nr:hypothetical protein [Desulfobacterales bacterium]
MKNRAFTTLMAFMLFFCIQSIGAYAEKSNGEFQIAWVGELGPEARKSFEEEKVKEKEPDQKEVSPPINEIQKQIDQLQEEVQIYFDKSDDFYKKKWTISGYLESENYFAAIKDKESSIENEKNILKKVEAHSKMDISYGDNVAYAKAVIHGYVYPENREENENYYKNSCIVQELYISALFPTFDIQLGKQIIRWGTANSINPTSYFNPLNLTEALLKDADEIYIGVFSISSTLLIKDYSLKLVFVPVHSPARLPSPNSLWELRWPNQSIPGTGMAFPIEYEPYNEPLDREIKNSGIGARFSGTAMGFDFSISSYHGPDKDLTLLPEAYIDFFNPNNSKIILVPQYKVISAIGGDIAFSIGDFTLQVETSYIFDKPAIQNTANMQSMEIEIEKVGYLYCETGINWRISDDFNIIIEYVKGIYTSDEDKYMKPFFSELAILSAERKFLDSRFALGIQGMYNTSDRDFQVVPKIGWDFQNGFIMELSGAVFYGEKDTFFGIYDERSIVILRAKYHF